jgi:hypothetical protein
VLLEHVYRRYIDRQAKNFCGLAPESSKVNERLAGFEVDQEVDIACSIRLFTGERSKHTQSSYPMPFGRIEQTPTTPAQLVGLGAEPASYRGGGTLLGRWWSLDFQAAPTCG